MNIQLFNIARSFLMPQLSKFDPKRLWRWGISHSEDLQDKVVFRGIAGLYLITSKGYQWLGRSIHPSFFQGRKKSLLRSIRGWLSWIFVRPFGLPKDKEKFSPNSIFLTLHRTKPYNSWENTNELKM